jgi:hypothetical protein
MVVFVADTPLVIFCCFSNENADNVQESTVILPISMKTALALMVFAHKRIRVEGK